MIFKIFQIQLFCSEVWTLTNIKIRYIKTGHFYSVWLPSGIKKDHPLSLNVSLLYDEWIPKVLKIGTKNEYLCELLFLLLEIKCCCSRLKVKAFNVSNLTWEK